MLLALRLFIKYSTICNTPTCFDNMKLTSSSPRGNLISNFQQLSLGGMGDVVGLNNDVYYFEYDIDISRRVHNSGITPRLKKLKRHEFNFVFIGEWNNNNIQTLLSVLRCFYLASGLKINLHKSKLMGIGVSSNVVAAAASLIGCCILTAPFNYLGMKVGSNMSRINSWDDVISKVFSRLSKWKLKLLSIGGHLTLLKLVLTLIPLYHMSIFKNMVLTSKKNGGLGVSRALDTHKLIPRRSSWQDVILAIHSLQSKGEVELKVLYKKLYALEMCKSISVTEKMGHPSLSHSFRRMPRGGVQQKNYGLLCSKVADLVLPNISDRWCWSLEGSQEFSVKSSRILIDNTILPKAEVPTRWLRVVPIKVNVHAWRVCLDKLPTRANLSLRGMDISSIACPLCNSTVESTSHFFLLVPWLAKFGENF
ncbi:RNA-directed DNA polymerase, eukaryota, reverse transcriptase zinc-binding domain protein [Tanacetum coccineum]